MKDDCAAVQVRGAPVHPVFLALLLTQGLWNSRRTLRMPEAQGPREGQTGDKPELRLLALGDSIHAGVGVSQTSDSLVAQLAREMAAATNRNLSWMMAGRNGRRSGGLIRSLDRLESPGADIPQLVLLSNGINDVTQPIPAQTVLRSMIEAIEAVEEYFPASLVFQLGLPPLGSFPALSQPLRRVLGRRADAIDRALASWIAPRPGTIHLPFPGPINAQDFAPDGYHPHEAGLARWASHLSAEILPWLEKMPLEKRS